MIDCDPSFISGILVIVSRCNDTVMNINLANEVDIILLHFVDM